MTEKFYRFIADNRQILKFVLFFTPTFLLIVSLFNAVGETADAEVFTMKHAIFGSIFFSTLFLAGRWSK